MARRWLVAGFLPAYCQVFARPRAWTEPSVRTRVVCHERTNACMQLVCVLACVMHVENPQTPNGAQLSHCEGESPFCVRGGLSCIGVHACMYFS